jgi:hypothetical protein
MVPEFEENLFHLECSGKRLDQDSRPDGVVGNTDIRLGEEENVVPETRLEVMFHLWEVEVWTRTTPDELMSVMVEVKSKVEKRGRDRNIVNGHAGLVEVPTPRPVCHVSEVY